MPRSRPAGVWPGAPVELMVPSGETLWRVHPTDRDPWVFNPSPRPTPLPGSPVLGGRFDSQDGSYAYFYAGWSATGALAESFARDLDYTKAGPRPLPYSRVAGKKISSVVTVRDVRLVVAYGAGAEQLGQDIWLTTCDEADYTLCREWAGAVRRWVPTSDGLVWKSRRDRAEDVCVLWGDPVSADRGCGIVDMAATSSEPLGAGPARVMLDQWLGRWRLYLEPKP